MTDTELRSWAEALKSGVINGEVARAVIRFMDERDGLRRAAAKPCPECGTVPPRITYLGQGAILAANGLTNQGVPLNPGPPLPDPLAGAVDYEPTVSLGSNDAMRRAEDRAAEGK